MVVVVAEIVAAVVAEVVVVVVAVTEEDSMYSLSIDLLVYNLVVVKEMGFA